METVIYKTFGIDSILELIHPAGDLGKHFKRNLPVWKPGQENELTKEFSKQKKLQDAMQENPKLAERLALPLSNLPYLPLTLKALSERPMLLHECFELKKFSYYALQIEVILEKAGLQSSYVLPDLSPFYAMLDPDDTKTPVFSISPSYDTKLAKTIGKHMQLQDKKRQVHQHLLKSAQTALKLNNPTPELVVSRTQTDLLDKLNTTKHYELAEENLANLTYRLLESKDLTSLKSQIQALEQELKSLEEQVLVKLSKRLALYMKQLNAAHKLLSVLDWDLAKAIYARQHHCTIPKISKSLGIAFVNAVNLPVKLQQEIQQRKYQPVDLRFSRPLNILTGPNMGGKTTALITTGQLCWLALHGIPVPAERAELCIFDGIWYNREQDEAEGLSSFGKEMVSLTQVLKKETRQLLLCDELAKGTNPLEGEAILCAILDYCSTLDSVCIAATHYDKPAKLSAARQFAIKGIEDKALSKLEKAGVTDLKAQLDMLNALMDYNLISFSGKCRPPRNAITVAQILGLPASILEKAKQQLD